MKHKTDTAPGEWYHCYNRGVEKCITFNGPEDYERFILLLYASNTPQSFWLSNLRRKDRKTIFTDPPFDTASPLVAIGTYSLMPNHFHLLLKEVEEGGIARFMQKLLTAYTMYYNRRFERTGPLFSGVFKSIHVDSDRYLKHLFAYIHMNPADLYDPLWKEKPKQNRTALKNFLLSYPYSSFTDYVNRDARPERVLIGAEALRMFDTGEAFGTLIDDAIDFYRTESPIH